IGMQPIWVNVLALSDLRICPAAADICMLGSLIRVNEPFQVHYTINEHSIAAIDKIVISANTGSGYEILSEVSGTTNSITIPNYNKDYYTIRVQALTEDAREIGFLENALVSNPNSTFAITGIEQSYASLSPRYKVSSGVFDVDLS